MQSLRSPFPPLVRPAMLLACLAATAAPLASAAPVAKAKPSAPPTKQLAQQGWLKSQLGVVVSRQKRLDKTYGYGRARTTLCTQARAQGVGWATRYCGTWGDWLYLNWEQDNHMFGAAQNALQTALYVTKRRALRPQEMDIYSWGMREWKISDATLERGLAARLQNDVAEMKMLDAAQPYCDKEDWPNCFKLKNAEAAYEKAHPCDFSAFSNYEAFTSVDEYNDRVVKMHTRPAIEVIPCK